MKKIVLLFVLVLIGAASINSVYAKTTSNSSLAAGIKQYKAGNYVASYNTFAGIIKKDPSNALAYYYYAISAAQVGKKDEAIENYAKVIDLSTNRKLTNYAQKGKTCLESPNKCNEPGENETDMDRFVRSSFGSGLSDEVRSDYEKLKIENLKREINRDEDISPAKFKEYKDFSSQAPTNDEIVNAMRVLQRAGLSNFGSNGYDLSLLNGGSNNQQLFNMLTGNGVQNLSPQVIQALLTNQMSAGF